MQGLQGHQKHFSFTLSEMGSRCKRAEITKTRNGEGGGWERLEAEQCVRWPWSDPGGDAGGWA